MTKEIFVICLDNIDHFLCLFYRSVYVNIDHVHLPKSFHLLCCFDHKESLVDIIYQIHPPLSFFIVFDSIFLCWEAKSGGQIWSLLVTGDRDCFEKDHLQNFVGKFFDAREGGIRSGSRTDGSLFQICLRYLPLRTSFKFVCQPTTVFCIH